MKGAGRFLLRQARARPLACFALLFLTGVLLAGRFSMPAQIVALVAAVPLFAALSLYRGSPRLAAALLLLTALPAGMLRHEAALHSVPEVRWTRYSASMTGRVAEEPFANPATGRVIAKFRLEEVDARPSRLAVRLYLRGDEEMLSRVAYGQRLSLTGHIWANDPVTNPYEFDFGAWLRRNGMSAMATAKIEDVEIVDAAPGPLTPVIAARQALSRRVDMLFPDQAPLVKALLLGDRSQLSDELRASLNATGTAHLICISGLHVSVLAAVLAALLGVFVNRRRAGVLAVLLLLPYGALVGFTPSFVRALVMFAILSFEPVAGRPSDGVTRLGTALLAALCINPLCVGDAGFVLSYSATAGLMLLTRPLGRLVGLRRIARHIPRHAPLYRAPLWRILYYFLGLLCASLAAQLASLPGVVAFFGVQPVAALPFNLICVPLCMLGYLVAVAAVLVSFMWMAAGLFLAGASQRLLSAMLDATALWKNLPVTGVRVGRYPLPLILLHAALMVASSNLTKLRPRWKTVLALCLIPVAGLSALWTLAGSWPFRVVFLDADQADCAVVTTRGHTYLIDAGDTYTPAADYLSATCLRLDGVFLSHPHQDHAGGLTDVLAAFTPAAIYVPAGWFDCEITSPAVEEAMQQAESMGIPILELSAQDRVTLSEDVALTVYNPVPGVETDHVNDLSLLALVEHENHGVLFTGDLEMPAEPEVIPKAEILKVAHHGADNATSARFLEACDPELAIISVGENSFGHPGAEALARLKDSGADILTTRERGAITLTLHDDAWRVHTFLEASQ